MLKSFQEFFGKTLSELITGAAERLAKWHMGRGTALGCLTSVVKWAEDKVHTRVYPSR